MKGLKNEKYELLFNSIALKFHSLMQVDCKDLPILSSLNKDIQLFILLTILEETRFLLYFSLDIKFDKSSAFDVIFDILKILVSRFSLKIKSKFYLNFIKLNLYDYEILLVIKLFVLKEYKLLEYLFLLFSTKYGSYQNTEKKFSFILEHLVIQLSESIAYILLFSYRQNITIFSPLLPSRKTITKLEKLFYLNSYLHINFINAINIHNQQFPIFLIDNYLINKKILFIENGSNNVETNLLLSVYLKVSDFFSIVRVMVLGKWKH
jgi:hypothetical protein